jgi:hypothetical protein
VGQGKKEIGQKNQQAEKGLLTHGDQADWVHDQPVFHLGSKIERYQDIISLNATQLQYFFCFFSRQDEPFAGYRFSAFIQDAIPKGFFWGDRSFCGSQDGRNFLWDVTLLQILKISFALVRRFWLGLTYEKQAGYSSS